jgi:N,N'-diacetyllegionaminate synthase
MKIGPIDLNQDILIVAEIGNNHEGSYTLAEELIGQAAQAGVGAVKFQTFRTEQYVSCQDKARFDQLKSFELTSNEFEKLSKVAYEAGLLFLSTPFDLESARFLNTIVPAFKIASGDNDFYPLLEVVAETGKPIIMSTGLADLTQIRYSKTFIEKTWRDLAIEQQLAILHCVSSYPTPPNEANLAVIPYLRRELQSVVGYSDHTMGLEAAVLAVALGARIIEKHFTIDKNFSDFKDHQLSADPQELVQLVQRVKDVSTLLGSEGKIVQQSEAANIKAVRRSIVARSDLPKGRTISWEDITWVRVSSGGLRVGKEHLVLGKTLFKPMLMGEPITIESLGGNQ